MSRIICHIQDISGVFPLLSSFFLIDRSVRLSFCAPRLITISLECFHFPFSVLVRSPKFYWKSPREVDSSK
uniref:Putative ovule protein n=1 Tax=Solanum chacoense TaxID=4108 RepID=A0A0V0I4C7_SOLCH